jgi:predicted RNA binding protein YcfA (HicA-like mRNA interferase family)
VNSDQLERALNRLGYFCQRQSGSHMTLVHDTNPAWQVGFPKHKPLKVGMLNRALDTVAEQQGLKLPELIRLLKL